MDTLENDKLLHIDWNFISKNTDVNTEIRLELYDLCGK